MLVESNGTARMSSIEQLAQVPAKHEENASNKFHLELSITDKQLKQAEYALGTAFCAAAVGVIAVKTGKLALIEKVLPELESSINAGYANILRRSGAAPKLNYYELRNGLQVTYSRNAIVENKIQDLVSLAHPLDGEAHLLRDGSRRVMSSGGQFGDQFFHDHAGKYIEAAFPSREQPLVWYRSNPAQTTLSKKAFCKIEDSFQTGYTKPVERWSDLFEQVSKL